MTVEQIATAAHGSQPRLGNPRETNLSHVLRVARAVPRGRARAVALLHDVIEDTSCDADTLRALGVGEVIIEAVELLTHEHTATHAEYLAGLEKIRALAEEGNEAARLARTVKLADLADNLLVTRVMRQDGRGRTARMLERRYSRAVEVLS